MSYNKVKAITLGMPYGTAMGRLRKQILFSLLEKYGENACFVCGQIIENSSDLSIEHKIPWEGRNADLFWSLENIAFSHLNCNRPHSIGAIKLRRHTKPGFAWCDKCKQELPESQFHKQEGRWNGLQKKCKGCKSILNAARPTTSEGRRQDSALVV